MSGSIDITLENRLEEIRRLADRVDAFCRESGIAPEHAFNLNLALDELITNVILYGYEDEDEHQIRIGLSWNDRELVAELVDDGRPFDPLTQSPEPQLEIPLEDRKIGGLGLHLVRTLMDEVRYRRDGLNNRLELVKRVQTD
jgi:anti-sigma regulatory factor (Ser/Thr protein kinase)